MRRSCRAVLAAIVVPTLGTVVGCGGGDGGGDTNNGTGPGNGFPTLAAVTATAVNSFSPSSVDIAANGRVTWTFNAEHTVVFASENAPDDIPPTTQGQVGRRFPVAGRYAYTCSIHPGMSGAVVVH